MTNGHVQLTAPADGSTFDVPPGVIVVATAKPRYAAVLEVIRHDGASIRTTRDGLALISCEVGVKRRFAYYSSEVLINGWEPCDQPSPAAYLPLRYAALDRIDLAVDGVLLIERHPLRECVWRTVPADGDDTTVVLLREFAADDLRNAVGDVLRSVELPASALQHCAAAVSDALAVTN